jgi:hypothetical protein
LDPPEFKHKKNILCPGGEIYNKFAKTIIKISGKGVSDGLRRSRGAAPGKIFLARTEILA